MLKNLFIAIVFVPGISGAADLWGSSDLISIQNSSALDFQLPPAWEPWEEITLVREKAETVDPVLEFCADTANENHRICELERKMAELRQAAREQERR